MARIEPSEHLGERRPLDHLHAGDSTPIREKRHSFFAANSLYAIPCSRKGGKLAKGETVPPPLAGSAGFAGEAPGGATLRAMKWRLLPFSTRERLLRKRTPEFFARNHRVNYCSELQTSPPA
jgi:hypothetical protein